MSKTGVFRGTVVSALLGLIALGGIAPAAAASAPTAAAAASGVDPSAVAAARALFDRQLHNGAPVVARAAASNSITDPEGDAKPTNDPRVDIIGMSADDTTYPGVMLSITPKQHMDSSTFPSGFLIAWGIDTDGDGKPDLLALRVQDRGILLDAASGAPVCPLSMVASSTSYAVSLPSVSCLGDASVVGIIGGLIWATGPQSAITDFAPKSGMMPLSRRTDSPRASYTLGSSGGSWNRFGSMNLVVGANGSGGFTMSQTNAPIVAVVAARTLSPALWAVTSDGHVGTADGGQFFGDLAGKGLNRPIVGMAVAPDGSGYWLVASDGGVFVFGSSQYFGSMGGFSLNQPIVGMALVPDGAGYWLVAADGGIFAFGSARFFGSMGSTPLNRPIVGMASAIDFSGYWMVASDGGVFSFGVPFYGSTGATHLNRPIVGMSVTRSGGGYRFVAQDGGTFSYGDAEYVGSLGGTGRSDIVGVATS